MLWGKAIRPIFTLLSRFGDFMLVRVNIGRKAGEIQDVEHTAARQMLADGRASAIDYDPVESSPVTDAKAKKS
jgi:hypothetical protein